jgi:RNA polymerase sigma factor (sigma-70 family)
MTNRLWETAIERAGALTASLALDDLPDADLLKQFISDREEQAFAAIVRRHGPLVWAVCRSLLFTEADAEDAFQATFLVLVRSASRVKKPNAIGAWLHTVAGRVCRNSLRSAGRRRKHERAAAVCENDRPVDGATWDRWQTAAHQEIDRLPESLRLPFVLCVLQGIRQPEAAKQLGWKIGTLSGRVCKAKQLLSEALARRGLAAASIAAALGASASPLSASLCFKGVVIARAQSVSTPIHELARGAMGGFMTKTKLIATMVVAGTLAVAVGTKALSTADAQGPPPVGPPGAGPGGGPPGAPGAPGGGGGRPGAPGGVGGSGGPPGFPGGPGGSGGFNPGASGGGGSMSGSMSHPKIEYQFVATPKADEFKKLLAKRGEEGWEYIGLVPGNEELIFKRVTRPGGVMGGFGSMPSGMGPPMPGGRTGPSSGGPGMPPGLPGSGPPGGATPPGAGPAGPMGPGPGIGFPGPGGGVGGPPPAAGGSGGGPPRQDAISIQTGETIRHRMGTKQTIDRLLNQDTKVAEITADPTDASRILIRGITNGTARIELTDENGTKEKYTVRVK